MEFGDRESFAIELHLDTNHGGEWLYGQFGYWIAGVRVGNFEEGTSLRDVLFQMKWLTFECGTRNGEALCALSPDEAFFRLDAALYGSTRAEINNEVWVPEHPARFEIKIAVDVFDSWKIYLIECGDKALLLFASVKDRNVKAATLEVGAFDRVIREAYEWLNECYEKESERTLAQRLPISE